MSYPVEDIEGIGPRYAKMLRNVGVSRTHHLLDRGATRKGLKELAAEAKLDEKQILKWVSMADLMRVRGVGEEYSELLEAAGVDTIKELRKRKPENLHQAMVDANAKRKQALVRQLPGPAQVKKWVAHAKKLTPVITHDYSPSDQSAESVATTRKVAEQESAAMQRIPVHSSSIGENTSSTSSTSSRRKASRETERAVCHKVGNAIVETIEDLKNRGGLKVVDVANIANVPKETVSRWSAGAASPQPRLQLVLSDLRFIVDRLSEFYTPDEVRSWLNSRNKLLDGRRAIDLIHDQKTETVLESIERLGDMAYL